MHWNLPLVAAVTLIKQGGHLDRGGFHALAASISKWKLKPVYASRLGHQHLRTTNHKEPTKLSWKRQPLKLWPNSSLAVLPCLLQRALPLPPVGGGAPRHFLFDAARVELTFAQRNS